MTEIRVLEYIEPQPVYYQKIAFVSTKRFNRVSREAVLFGSEMIGVQGKTIIEANSILRGDLGPISIGSHCLIGSGTVLRPCNHRTKTGALKSLPLSIGDFVRIGSNSIIEAASIGNHCMIGDAVVVGKRSVIGSGVVIDNNAVLSDQCVCPPLTRWAGNPARIVQRLPDSFVTICEEQARSYFKSFIQQTATSASTQASPRGSPRASTNRTIDPSVATKLNAIAAPPQSSSSSQAGDTSVSTG